MKVIRRRVLVILLCLSSAYTAWVWFRPYSWQHDAKARFKMDAAQIRRDYDIYWLDLYLKQDGAQAHDPAKPVALMTANGKRHTAEMTTLETPADGGAGGVYFKFLLDSADLAGPIKLRLNDGELVVKSNDGMPALENNASCFERTSNW